MHIHHDEVELERCKVEDGFKSIHFTPGSITVAGRIVQNLNSVLYLFTNAILMVIWRVSPNSFL